MVQESKGRKCIVAVRIRGTVSAQREARATMRLLGLTRNNYAVLLDDRPSFIGMLEAIRNYVTWGEPTKDIIKRMIEGRGRLFGNRKLTSEFLKNINCESFEDLAQAIFAGKVEYWKLRGVQPIFRMPPPSKGYRGKIKRSYTSGGELGNRGEAINELLNRMV